MPVRQQLEPPNEGLGPEMLVYFFPNVRTLACVRRIGWGGSAGKLLLGGFPWETNISAAPAVKNSGAVANENPSKKKLAAYFP